MSFFNYVPREDATKGVRQKLTYLTRPLAGDKVELIFVVESVELLILFNQRPGFQEA